MPTPATSSRRRGRPAAPRAGSGPIDIHVGSRVRLRRTLLGMSQEKLGEAIGLTFQQIQKYERGANRISASRLFDLSRVLDVPISFFFDDMPESADAVARHACAANATVHEPDPLAKRETLEMMRAYGLISDPTIRKRLLDLTRSMAGTSSEHASA